VRGSLSIASIVYFQFTVPASLYDFSQRYMSVR
jgi:hypothetical protein